MAIVQSTFVVENCSFLFLEVQLGALGEGGPFRVVKFNCFQNLAVFPLDYSYGCAWIITAVAALSEAWKHIAL